ncbi:MAG TPA: hypothetical protein VM822_18695 [Pseudolabrys sp.]|jgi:hypothetical protein|nr:hypothetical protein [Pseudolabrys sp.]
MEELIDLQSVQHKKEEDERFELEPNATSLTLFYRSPSLPLLTRLRAATAALPHEHPKLAVMATVHAGDLAAQLDRAIERSRKVIEATPLISVPSENVSSDDSDTKPTNLNTHKPSVPDRRYRRW